MFQSIARKVLKKELDATNKSLNTGVKNCERLEGIVKGLSEECEALNKSRPLREYAFAPQTITADEQKIVGEFVDTPIFDLYNKWFKSKADQNNDLLIHTVKATEEQKSLWRLAVLMYEDWHTFNQHCLKTHEAKEPKV